jgi:sugar phosphate isomerase/epimerase
MKISPSRRRFLKQSGQAVAATAMLPLLSRSGRAEDSATTYPVTCRDRMLQTIGIEDCWAAMKAVDADGVEARIDDDLSLPGLFHPSETYSCASDAAIEKLQKKLDQEGRIISSLMMGNHFDEKPRYEVRLCVLAAVAAQKMGVPAIRIDVVPRKIPREKFLDFAVDILSEIMEKTESTGVNFAIENHGNTTNDPEFLEPLFERVGSPRLGLTLDTANFYWYGHPLSDLYDIYRKFAPRAFHTHCKSIDYPADKENSERPMGWEYGKYHCPITEGDIDFQKVLAILKKAGYSNDLCIENEMLHRLEPEKARETLAAEIRMLREIR